MTFPGSDRLGANAQTGWRVRYVPADVDTDDARVRWGSNRDPRLVLVTTDTYVISKVEVHSFHTKVWLESIGGPFNSTHFVRMDA